MLNSGLSFIRGFGEQSVEVNLSKANTFTKQASLTNTEGLEVSNFVENGLLSFTDSTESGRFTRFSNPMVEYEYRKGTYFTTWADRFPNLTLSIIELGRNEYFAK